MQIYIYCIWKTINKVKCNFKNVLFYHLLLSMSVKLFNVFVFFTEDLKIWLVDREKKEFECEIFSFITRPEKQQETQTMNKAPDWHSTNNSVSVQLFLLNGMKRLSAGIAATYPQHFYTVFCFTIVWRQWVLHNNHSSLDILHACFRKSVFN